MPEKGRIAVLIRLSLSFFRIFATTPLINDSMLAFGRQINNHLRRLQIWRWGELR